MCCPYEGDGCYDFVANSDPQCPEQSASVFHDDQHNATICCADNTVGFYLEKYGYVGCAENMALARSSNENYTLVEMDRLSTATTSSTTSMYKSLPQRRSIVPSFSLTRFGKPSQQALLPRIQPPQAPRIIPRIQVL